MPERARIGNRRRGLPLWAAAFLAFVLSALLALVVLTLAAEDASAETLCMEKDKGSGMIRDW